MNKDLQGWVDPGWLERLRRDHNVDGWMDGQMDT